MQALLRPITVCAWRGGDDEGCGRPWSGVSSRDAGVCKCVGDIDVRVLLGAGRRALHSLGEIASPVGRTRITWNNTEWIWRIPHQVHEPESARKVVGQAAPPQFAPLLLGPSSTLLIRHYLGTSTLRYPSTYIPYVGIATPFILLFLHLHTSPTRKVCRLLLR